MQPRETKIKLEKQDIDKRRASPRQPRHPGRACRGSWRQNHLTNYSAMTQVVSQCGVKLQSDYVAAIRHMAAFPYREYP